MAEETKKNFFEDTDNVSEEEEEDIITLHNEKTDKDEDFYHLATLDVDQKWYVVMKPVASLPDIEDDEVLIYEIVEDEDGNDMFAAVDDEKQLDKVFNEFMRQVDAYVESEDSAKED